MGTVGGVNTRRYHALLVASLKPPTERFVLLSRFEEEVVIGDRTYALGSCQYPGVLVNDGSRFLEDFVPEPCSTWRYNLGGIAFERQVYLVPNRQAVVVRYRCNRALTLRIRPFLAYRDYHSLRHAGESPYAGLPPLEFRSEAEFAADPKWYYNFEYLAELDRGLDFREDLFTPGVLTLDLDAGVWTPICASIDGTDPAQPPAEKRDSFIVRRADGKPTIIAGYPWFTDWGRDTMISLPGLLITPGFLDEAREIIQGFLQFRSQGIIPNRFPDAGETPEYNTADATLWFIEAIRAFLHYSGDEAFVRERLYPKLKDIIDWHVRGTRYGIHVDTDGLLACGAPGIQLTWMDAKVGEYVVTPRTGKPVEIQALWYNALRIMADFARRFSDSSAEALYGGLADEARETFNARFWNPLAGCLYDVVENGHSDGSMRPNQIFAVSLTHSMLSPEKASAVVQAVQNELLTPMGLRTLSRHDPRYRARYEGGVAERDTAYHLGTVWPWLMGPFITAYLKVNQRSETARQQAESWLGGFAEHLTTAGLGQICEIADAEYPYTPRGCIAQAWSVAEILRAAVEDVYAMQSAPVKTVRRSPSRTGQTPSLARAARSSSRLSTGV